MAVATATDEDGDEVCPNCGELIIYQGGCWVCLNCGETGCG